METSGGSESSGGEDAEARRARRGHVLTELLHTERIYVQELGSILKVDIIFISKLDKLSLVILLMAEGGFLLMRHRSPR